MVRITRRASRRVLLWAGLGAAILGALWPSAQSLSAATPAPGHRAAAATQTLPVALQGVISGAIGRDQRAYRVRGRPGALTLWNPRHDLRARFAGGGVSLRQAGQTLRLRLAAVGYGRALGSLPGVAPGASLNRVSFRRGSLREWYVNGPAGIEQGFTLGAPPEGRGGGPLTIAMDLSGTLRPRLSADGRELSFAAAGRGAALSYRGLWARDSRGRDLRAWLELRGRRLLVRVDDSGARYPLTIDPFIQQAKLTASDGADHDRLGFSVAVNGDTVVAGAPSAAAGHAFQGALYVFTRPAGGWADATQTAKLTASDGAADDRLGSSLAIDGDTVVALSPFATVGETRYQGAVYLFSRPPSGWADATETAKLTASDGAAGDFLGGSVSISGESVVAGAAAAAVGANARQGALYVFTRPASGWASATQTGKLTAADGTGESFLGGSVATAGDTVIAAAEGADARRGALYVFTRPDPGWTDGTHAARLTASDAAPDDALGRSLATDGDTVVAGAPSVTVAGNEIQGVAYVFTKGDSGWVDATEAAKLTGSDSDRLDRFGHSVAVDGDTIVVGAPGAAPGAGIDQGAAYVFVRSGSGWSGAAEEKLTAADGADRDSFGSAVSVDGDAVAVGADGGGDGRLGAVYVFHLPPPHPLNIKFGAFAPKQVRLGREMTVRFQARNLSFEPLRDVIVVIPLPDQENFVSLDCGPLGEPLGDGGLGCRYAVLPARTLVRLTARVSVCCAFPPDTAVTNFAFVLGTEIGDSVTTTLDP